MFFEIRIILCHSMRDKIMGATFNPCFQLPKDPFTESENFCNLQVGENRLIKMDQEPCYRVRQDREQGYLCKDRFFPATFGYLPTLKDTQRATLFFRGGFQIKDVLLPVSELERAAELLDKVVLRESILINRSKITKILQRMVLVPDSHKKDTFLEKLAFTASNAKLFDEAVQTARRIKDLELKVVTLGRIVSYADYRSKDHYNHPAEVLNEVWDLTDKIKYKSKKNFLRVLIIQFQSKSGFFYEAFAFTFLIRNHEERGKARVDIAQRWLEKEPTSSIPSWLLELAEADYLRSAVAGKALFEEITKLRSKPNFVPFQLQKKAVEYHKPNLESLQNVYNEATRLSGSFQDSFKASLRRVRKELEKEEN